MGVWNQEIFQCWFIGRGLVVDQPQEDPHHQGDVHWSVPWVSRGWNSAQLRLWGVFYPFYIIFEPLCLQKSPTSSFCVDKTVLGELLVSWVQTFPGCFVGHHFHLGFLLQIMKEEMEIMRKIRPWAVPSVPLTLLW